MLRHARFENTLGVPDDAWTGGRNLGMNPAYERRGSRGPSAFGDPADLTLAVRPDPNDPGKTDLWFAGTRLFIRADVERTDPRSPRPSVR